MKILSSLCGRPDRLRALRRFAVTITVVTLLGHLYIGFETSYSCTIVSVLSACSVQLLLDWIRTKAGGEEPGFSNGRMLDFLLPAYIVGMTCAMFLFTNGRHWPLVFATTFAISSKFLFRINVGDRTTHFMNPSNLAIIVTLLAFPSVAMIMPFSFSAGFGNVGDVLFPLVLFTLGCLLNGIFTKRIVLIFTWFAAFVLQAMVRHVVFDAQLLAMVAGATGPIAIIFSFYMISDPGTTPDSPLGQIAFGASIGIFYGILIAAHVVYGIFWALLITCAIRGLFMYIKRRQTQVATASPESRLAANA